MLRNHCFAERFRSQVCDVFFAPDSAHLLSLRSDLVLCPRVRHINVLQLPNSMPVENVLSGFCVDGQHWFHCKAQASCFGLPLLPTLRCCRQLCLCAAFCNDLLLACLCLQGVTSQHQHAFARRLSSLLATGPVRIREHCQLLGQYSIFKHLSPLPLAFQVSGKPF